MSTGMCKDDLNIESRANLSNYEGSLFVLLPARNLTPYVLRTRVYLHSFSPLSFASTISRMFKKQVHVFLAELLQKSERIFILFITSFSV